VHGFGRLEWSVADIWPELAIVEVVRVGMGRQQMIEPLDDGIHRADFGRGVACC
jgi:hypothetical protein